MVGWVGLSVVLAPLIGIALREADVRERESFGAAPERAARPARVRRRRIPLPPVSVALLLTGITLEAVGFVVRTSGNERGAGRLWSMDLPLAVPRMFVAALFAAAALAALLGAARATGRRPWWLAVGLIAAVIAQVKAGGTVHVRALETAGVSDRPLLATVGSIAVVGVVLVALWLLSRNERRDRRRVLTALAIYAVAAAGLSGVSSLVGQAGASAFWVASATFIEECGEVLGGVAVLTAVLVGVAPRLVLPAAWALRRTADAETVDAPAPQRRPGDLRW
ncbi:MULTISPECIES: hypothetical protein [unclassified Modestobacter]